MDPYGLYQTGRIAAHGCYIGVGREHLAAVHLHAVKAITFGEQLLDGCAVPEADILLLRNGSKPLGEYMGIAGLVTEKTQAAGDLAFHQTQRRFNIDA